MKTLYLLCNRTLHDPRCRQGGPITPQEYLHYLEFSLLSFSLTHPQELNNVLIWLAEFEPDPHFQNALLALLGRYFAKPKEQLWVFPHQLTMPLWQDNLSSKLFSSGIHHILLYYMLAQYPAELIYFSDVDILYLAEGYLALGQQVLIQNPQAAFCGYMQPPYTNDPEHIEQRLHTVSFFVNSAQLRKLVPFEILHQAVETRDPCLLFSEIKNLSLKQKLLERAKNNLYYGDTFTEFTYYLIEDQKEPGIIDLFQQINNSGYDKQFPFTIFNPYVIHAKYLSKEVLASLMNSFVSTNNSSMHSLLLKTLALLSTHASFD
jgi:hypothetical protein